MFVIVHENFVVWGPKNWNKLGFEDVLRTDCEVEYTLPQRNDARTPFIINENTKILPVVAAEKPAINPKIQRHQGPFWTFHDAVVAYKNVERNIYSPPGPGGGQVIGTEIVQVVDTENSREAYAEESWVAENLPIDWVKGQLKGIVAANRYKKEIEGIKVPVQGDEVSVDTSRDGRQIYFDTYLAMSEQETIGWKFNEKWKTVGKNDLGLIVLSGKNHIQGSFNWEAAKVAEIDAATTLEQLDEIVLEP
jgi:hypothetical protein